MAFLNFNPKEIDKSVKKASSKNIDLKKLAIYNEENVTNDMFDLNNFDVLKWVVFNVCFND